MMFSPWKNSSSEYQTAPVLAVVKTGDGSINTLMNIQGVFGRTDKYFTEIFTGFYP